MNTKRLTPKHIIIKMSKVSIEKILKLAKEKQLVMYKGTPIKVISISVIRNFTENCQKSIPQKGVARYIQSVDRKTSNQEYSTWQSWTLELREKDFSHKEKLKEFITH